MGGGEWSGVEKSDRRWSETRPEKLQVRVMTTLHGMTVCSVLLYYIYDRYCRKRTYSVLAFFFFLLFKKPVSSVELRDSLTTPVEALFLLWSSDRR